MNATSQFSYFKLLTTAPRFAELITATAPKRSVLPARLTYSLLAHRSRLGIGSSARDISERTGLHQNTVSDALVALNSLVHKQGNHWIANEPQERLFFTIAPIKPQHWSDYFAYLKLFLPEKGAKIIYAETERRFGLNHALIWSLLHGRVKNSVVHGFTVAGAAAMFSLNPKTVSSIMDDLVWLRLIGRTTHKITMLPMTDHAKLFRPKHQPEEENFEPKEKRPPLVPAPFILQNDLWDSARKHCDGLMPQKTAELAISKAMLLGEDPHDFEAQFHRAKERHDNNVLTGKVSTGNFGKYLVTCFEKRIQKQEEQEREAEEQQRRETYYLSPEFAQKRMDEEKTAAADPQHGFFNPMDDKSIFDRVDIDNCLLARIKTQIHNRIRWCMKVKDLSGQELINKSCDLRCQVIRRVLSSLNGYYLQPVRASAEDFRTQIEAALEEVCGDSSCVGDGKPHIASANQ